MWWLRRHANGFAIDWLNPICHVVHWRDVEKKSATQASWDLIDTANCHILHTFQSREKKQRTEYTTIPHYKHNASVSASIFLWRRRRQQWRLNFPFAEYNARNKSVSVRPSLGGSRLNRSSKENYVQKIRRRAKWIQILCLIERTPAHAISVSYFSEECIYVWHAIGSGADDKTTLFLRILPIFCTRRSKSKNGNLNEDVNHIVTIFYRNSSLSEEKIKK